MKMKKDTTPFVDQKSYPCNKREKKKSLYSDSTKNIILSAISPITCEQLKKGNK